MRIFYIIGVVVVVLFFLLARALSSAAIHIYPQADRSKESNT